ncbi:MAG: hypothetical protein QG568_188 [Patescibacteria group bacterium]|nr:hypothetical protein [Patescibacteria group bacterium]
MVHKDENRNSKSTTATFPAYGPDGTEYVTVGFMMQFKTDLLEILGMRFNDIENKYEMLEKDVRKTNKRVDTLISQNALEHHDFDVRITASSSI